MPIYKTSAYFLYVFNITWENQYVQIIGKSVAAYLIIILFLKIYKERPSAYILISQMLTTALTGPGQIHRSGT